MKKYLLLALCTTFFTFAHAQSDNCHLQLGINLAGPVDYGSEWPFVNIMKYARPWETTNIAWTGGQNLWNSELLHYFEFDEQGYPLEVPLAIDHPNADTLQVIRTVWANTFALPEGSYVLLYDGQGEIDFRFDGQIVSQSPGRIEVELTHQDNIMALYILASEADDPLRNLRFLLPGHEATYLTEPWTPSWLEKLAPFRTLRFLDWGRTNNSTLQHWEDRPQVDDYTYTRRGIPYEHWMELCNLKQADAWVCVPHRADPAYVTELATLFRDNLDPGLNIYVEYSNEVWNWLFDQAHYGEAELDQGLPWPERLAPRIAEVMQGWTDVFGPDTTRLVRVLGGQHGWFDIIDRIYAQLEAGGQDHLIDALSPAGYLSPDHDQLADLGAAATVQDVIAGAAAYSFDPAGWILQGWQAHAGLAAEKGKQLLFYEGGQHFTPEPWGTVQPYNLALLEAQVAPEMYDLYRQLLDTLAGLSEEEMTFLHFSFIAPLGDAPEDARWGSFGALTSQFFQSAPYADAPKYRVLTEHIGDCEETVPVQGEPTQKQSVTLFPNPAGEGPVRLRFGRPFSGRVEIFSINGAPLRATHAQEASEVELALGAFPAGVYVVQIIDEDGSRSVKRVVR